MGHREIARSIEFQPQRLYREPPRGIESGVGCIRGEEDAVAFGVGEAEGDGSAEGGDRNKMGAIGKGEGVAESD